MVDRTSPLATLLIVAASVTASVVVTMLLHPDDAGQDVAPAIGIDPSRIEELESRVAELERSAPELRTDATPTGTASRTDPGRRAIDAHNNILSLAHLEKRLLALESRVPDREADRNLFGGGQARIREQSRAEIIRTAQGIILNTESSETDKINAHGMLRRVDNAYTPRMTQEMIDIGRTSESAGVRAQVWTLFDGSSAAKLPELIPALTDSLFHDDSPQVRSEAAETLGNFASDAHVIALLEQVAKNDGDASVRRKATRTLHEMKIERAKSARRR
jgi:HEAT repeats